MQSRLGKLRETFFTALYTRIAPAETGLRIIEAAEKGAINLRRSFTLDDVFAALDMPKLARDLGHVADPLQQAVPDAMERVQLYVRLALNTMMTSSDAVLDAKCVYEDETGIRYALTRGDLKAIQNKTVFLHPVMGYEVHNPHERTFLEFRLKEAAIPDL